MTNREARAIINANIAERWPGLGTLPVRFSYIRCANAIRSLYELMGGEPRRFTDQASACAYLRRVAERIQRPQIV